MKVHNSHRDVRKTLKKLGWTDEMLDHYLLPPEEVYTETFSDATNYIFTYPNGVSSTTLIIN